MSVMRSRVARIWLLVTLLSAVLFLSAAGAGPAVHADHDHPDATQVKFFVPWMTNGMLNPALTVRARNPFEGCQTGAITTQRPDAWRCGTADPCFAYLFGDRMQVACSSAPWSNEVVVLLLDRPLPEPDECRMMPTMCPRPLDLDSPPWAVELANGAKCTAFTGTRSVVAGMIIAYGCDNGGSIAAANEATFDKTLPVWRAFYLAGDGFVVEQVDVLVVWR